MASLSNNSIHESEHHGAPSSFVKRWLYSTNHKDIGTMYIIFSLVAAIIGGGESTSVTFATAGLNAGDAYSFFCTVMSHSVVMKGTFVLKG